MFQSGYSSKPQAPPRRKQGRSLSSSRTSLEHSGQPYDRDALAFNHYIGFLNQPLKRHLSSDIAYLVPSVPFSAQQHIYHHPVTSNRPPTPGDPIRGATQSPGVSATPPLPPPPPPLAASKEALYAVPRKILKQRSLDNTPSPTNRIALVSDSPSSGQELTGAILSNRISTSTGSLAGPRTISISSEKLFHHILTQQAQLERLQSQQEFLQHQLMVAQEEKFSKRGRKFQRSRNSSEGSSRSTKRSSSREKIQEQLHQQQTRVQKHIQQLQEQLELIRDIRSSSRTSSVRDAQSSERMITTEPSNLRQPSSGGHGSRSVSPRPMAKTLTGVGQDSVTPSSPESVQSIPVKSPEFRSDDLRSTGVEQARRKSSNPTLILTNPSRDSRDEPESSSRLGRGENAENAAREEIPYMDEEDSEIETVLEMGDHDHDHESEEDDWDEEIGFYSDGTSPERDLDPWRKLREEDIRQAQEEMLRQNEMLLEQEQLMAEQQEEIIRERNILDPGRDSIVDGRFNQAAYSPAHQIEQSPRNSQPQIWQQTGFHQQNYAQQQPQRQNLQQQQQHLQQQNERQQHSQGEQQRLHQTPSQHLPPPRPPPPRSPSPIPFNSRTYSKPLEQAVASMNPLRGDQRFLNKLEHEIKDFSNRSNHQALPTPPGNPRNDRQRSPSPLPPRMVLNIPDKPARSNKLNRQQSAPLSNVPSSPGPLSHEFKSGLNSDVIRRPFEENNNNQSYVSSSILRSQANSNSFQLAALPASHPNQIPSQGFQPARQKSTAPVVPPRRRSFTPIPVDSNDFPSFRIPRGRSRTPSPGPPVPSRPHTNPSSLQTNPHIMVSGDHRRQANNQPPIITRRSPSPSPFDARRSRSPSPSPINVPRSRSPSPAPRTRQNHQQNAQQASLGGNPMNPNIGEMSTLKLDAMTIRSNRPSRSSSPAPVRSRSPSPKPKRRVFISKDTSEAGSFVDHFNHYYAPSLEKTHRPPSRRASQSSPTAAGSGDLRVRRSVSPMHREKSQAETVSKNGTLPIRLKNPDSSTAYALVDGPISQQRRQTLPELVKVLGIEESGKLEDSLHKMKAQRKKHSLPQDDLNQAPPIPGWEREKVSAMAHEAREARMNAPKGPGVHLSACFHWLLKYKFAILLLFFNVILAYIFLGLLNPEAPQDLDGETDKPPK